VYEVDEMLETCVEMRLGTQSDDLLKV